MSLWGREVKGISCCCASTAQTLGHRKLGCHKRCIWQLASPNQVTTEAPIVFQTTCKQGHAAAMERLTFLLKSGAQNQFLAQGVSVYTGFYAQAWGTVSGIDGRTAASAHLPGSEHPRQAVMQNCKVSSSALRCRGKCTCFS